MTDEQFSYSQAKGRLDEIVAEVRKKDISLEKSLDLLEEGVSLANKCTELIDQADWAAAEQGAEADEAVEQNADAGETDEQQDADLKFSEEDEATEHITVEDETPSNEAEFDGDSKTDEDAAQ